VVDKELSSYKEHQNPNMELDQYYLEDVKENNLLHQSLYREKVGTDYNDRQ
jgi:hypothetical protein